MAVSAKHQQFLNASEVKAFDRTHRRTIRFNIGKYDAAVTQGLTYYADHELARTRAAHVKATVLANLDKYLIEWERHFTARGGRVIWAATAEDALREIGALLHKRRAKLAVKSKSMSTEEIHLNDFLEKNGVETVETDLGEYIVQLRGEPPYHIVTPAMHLSKADIAQLFHEKLGIPLTDDAQVLVNTARKLMRQKYTQADVGITGANFLLADIGGVAVTENEGNGRLSTTFPRLHVVVAGIEKILPSLTDLDLFWPLLSTSGTGQKLTVYNTVFTGPRQPNETDGPDEMVVVLLDNGRTELLAQPDRREALQCIRCGAWLNVCPVYRNIGGHTYETTYSGPIGSVISPHLVGMEETNHLSFASSLCGACTSVCPVRINLHNLLLLNRRQSVQEGHQGTGEKRVMGLWKRAMMSRRLLDLAPGKVKNWALGWLLRQSGWTDKRAPLEVAPKSFAQLWKEKRG
ncbi:MAG: lactate utilization protein [Hymenobacteraceae bacterium]|nr:lactate utilization protein [Hymenobacteraceae bacterium]